MWWSKQSEKLAPFQLQFLSPFSLLCSEHGSILTILNLNIVKNWDIESLNQPDTSLLQVWGQDTCLFSLNSFGFFPHLFV